MGIMFFGNGAGMQLATAQQEVYSYLREQIFSGKLKAGARLNPAEIASALGVSRMPVREALRQLDSEGFIAIRPNRGAIVMILTPQDVEEIFQIRTALEVLAVRVAIPKLDEAAIGELENLRAQMDRVHDNPSLWVRQHDAFHDTLCGYSGLARVGTEIKRFRTLIHPYMMQYFVEVHHTPEMAGHEHSTIISALRSRNCALAEIAMRDHIMSAAQAVIQFLASDAPQVAGK
jgi:DNA-binding GntR family transcriptional regulator